MPVIKWEQYKMFLRHVTAVFFVSGLLASNAIDFSTRYAPSTSSRKKREIFSRQIASPSGPQQVAAPDYCARCGIRGGSQAYSGQKIVDGTPAEPLEFPWRCIILTDYDAPGGFGFCSCTILSPEWVLTAAHCTYGHRPEKILVDAGDYDLSGILSRGTPDGYPNQAMLAAEVIIHQDYNPWNFENDISVIRLSRPLQFAPNIQPICLPYKFLGRSFDWQSVTVSGWGYENENGSLSKLLKKVDMTLIPVDACREFFAGSGNSVIPMNQVCAYYLPAGGKGQCRGDSGSSYDFLDPASGRYYAVGVESFSRVQCAVALGPSLASRVTHFLNWIDYVTGTHFCG